MEISQAPIWMLPSAQADEEYLSVASHFRDGAGYFRSWRAMTMRWIWLVPS